VIPYFNYRLTYVPDPILGFRERPQHKAAIRSFRGWGYSPLYGIEVQPQTLLWETDEQGFRNDAATDVADIVVIGSSFAEYGQNFEDTYAHRLEKRLDGQKVLNFSKAGYGPIEYINVFERYALAKKPRYVILALNVVGDIDAHLADRIRGKSNPGLAKRAIAFGGFFPRYRIALEQTLDIATSSIWVPLQLGFQKVVGNKSIHPDVAVLRFPHGATNELVFLDKHVAKTPEELLRSPEWRAFEQLIIQFKELSESQGIVPLLLYIPGATEIYSRYSTLESGAQWLAVRDSMIVTAASNGEAARTIAARVGIELIDLRSAFDEAARHGQLVYYRLDSHWNGKGREIAAEITARALKKLGLDQRPRELKPTLPRLDPILREARKDATDSVMYRTLDGKINFWNPAAEQLYGWKKSEALGRVSHDLLRTQFPEPLEKIDAELIQNGRWKGTLVHLTRDGRRVTVESRWVLERNKDRGAVVEINTPLG
jgi:PAS domain S-box-containing protein